MVTHPSGTSNAATISRKHWDSSARLEIEPPIPHEAVECGPREAAEATPR